MFNNPLEGKQLLHNRIISDSASVSPSNNPQQIARDVQKKRTEELLGGAAALAAGETLGLNTEETLKLISRETRRQKRADHTITEEDVMRQMAQTQKSLAEAGPAELAGIALREQPEIDPFGSMQDDIQTYSRDEAVMYGLIPESQMYNDELIRRGDAMERPSLGTAGVADALARLEASKNTAPGAAAVAGALEQSLGGRIQRDADASMARDIVMREAAKRNPLREGYSDVKAAIEAEDIARRDFTIGGKGAIADEVMRRIGGGSQEVMPSAMLDTRTGTYMGADGNPLAIQGPERAMAGVNASDTANMLNAPQKESAINYVVKQLPDFREGGRVFGDFNQTDMTGASTLFAQRVAQSGLVDPRRIPGDIRTVEEFQGAINMLSGAAAQQGTQMYRMEQQQQPDGRILMNKTAVPAAQVGAGEVMNYLRYTPAEAGQFANMLYQAEVAKATQINQNAKNTYFGRGAVAAGPKDNIVFSAAEAISPRDGEAQVARIRGGQTVGSGKEKTDIKAAFRQLSEPGARQPFIGQVEGQPPRINRYVPKSAGGLSTEEIPAALREKEMGFARNKAQRAMRKEGSPISPARVDRRAAGMMDEVDLKNKTTKAQLVRERTVRDNKARYGRERNIRTRVGTPPAEPGRMGGAPQSQAAPTGPTQSGDAYQSKIARERYNRNITKEQEEANSFASKIRRLRGM